MNARFLRRSAALIFALGLITACSDQPQTDTDTPDTVDPRYTLVDPNASDATRALQRNLWSLTGEALLFGHQDSLAYGVTWFADPLRSDVHDVTGAFPAVYGWELGNLALGHEQNLDGVNFANMQEWIRTGFRQGSIITLGWHMTSPVTGEDAWVRQPTVEHIIPGGAHHDALKAYLDTLADFVRTLTFEDDVGQEQLIPIIFRPWHEHNGDWFWWGKGHVSERDFITLWRFTVNYLRDEKGLNNLLYAFSPDRSRTDLANFEQDYFYAYPGDDYVDILGFDNYWDLGHASNTTPTEQQMADFVQSLDALGRIAAERQKLTALTEAGQDTLTDANFYTERFLPGFLATDNTRRMVYTLVWRNANRDKEERDHFYAPYPDHPAAADFVDFYEHPFTRFNDGLPPLYQ
ncbi:glycoside hydrolase family 26 protein [Marinimicrobium alkaliphilum]|uniref:glycoside hydrolase family 26 protein n=1 Tax=Marinimicrobium alkaliphilum TaxID=2202654 RepID=UPI000DBA250D|nr:glycosyl hydrolase [Marinimicrobium alkaliphilum]